MVTHGSLSFSYFSQWNNHLQNPPPRTQATTLTIIYLNRWCPCPAPSHPGHLYPESRVHIPLPFFFNSFTLSVNIPKKHIFIAFHVVRKGMVLYVVFGSTWSFFLIFMRIAKIRVHHCTWLQVICLDSCLIFHCVATSQCIHPYSRTDGHLGCFQVFAIVNRTAVNILVRVSRSPRARDSLGYMPRCKVSWTIGHVNAELLGFMPDCFPKSLHRVAEKQKIKQNSNTREFTRSFDPSQLPRVSVGANTDPTPPPPDVCKSQVLTPHQPDPKTLCSQPQRPPT